MIAAAICIAVALVRSAATAVRIVWVAGALMSAGALIGYAISRLLPLPGMADHQGDWINAYGVLAMLAEIGLIALAAHAMRVLTVRGVPYRLPAWTRDAYMRVWSTVLPVLVFTAMPDVAFGHGGEEDEAGGTDASGAPASRGGGEDAAGAGTAHGDPFLGTTELGLASLVSIGFILWAAQSLHARTQPESATA